MGRFGRDNSRACDAGQILFGVSDRQLRFCRGPSSATTRLFRLIGSLGFGLHRSSGTRTALALAGDNGSETIRLCACNTCEQAIWSIAEFA
jgi:hypothetical protein